MCGSFTTVVWQSVVRTIAGQAESRCFPTPRLRCLCPRNSDRLWLVASDVRSHCLLFFFTYIRHPPKRQRPYSHHLRRSCESSLPHVELVIKFTEIPHLIKWCCDSPVCFSHDPSPSRATVCSACQLGPCCGSRDELQRHEHGSNVRTHADTLSLVSTHIPTHKHGRTVGPCVGLPTLSFHEADRRSSLRRVL